ncbi:MAG: DinB family protein [Saonia sp.]
MKNLLHITLQQRKVLHGILIGTPREVLLGIPEGYNNNIWWNVAHVVVTQQLLVYGLSKLPKHIDEELVQKYRKGTVPDGTATVGEIEKIKGLLLLTIEKTLEDYQNGLFKEYKEYTTSTKTTLRNIDDALAFNLYHEGLHMGTIRSLTKAHTKADVS